jgi:hypothetical protein
MRPALTCLLALAACGGAPPLREQLHLIETARCESAARCCGLPVDACLAREPLRVQEDALARQQRGLEAGELVYDAEAARGCVEALRTVECDAPIAAAFQSGQPDCKRMLLGTLAPGARCEPDRAGGCVEAAYCDPQTLACVPWAAIGEACASRQCAPGSECSTPTTPPKCVATAADRRTVAARLCLML